MAAYRKLKTNIKYVPTTLPDNTNSMYDVSAVDTNKKYLEEMLGEDISVVLVKVIQDLDNKYSVMVEEKYQEMQEGNGKIIQGMQR